MGIKEFFVNEVILELNVNAFKFIKDNTSKEVMTYLWITDDQKRTVLAVGSESTIPGARRRVDLSSPEAKNNHEYLSTFMKYGIGEVLRGKNIFVRPDVLVKFSDSVSSMYSRDEIEKAIKVAGAKKVVFI